MSITCIMKGNLYYYNAKNIVVQKLWTQKTNEGSDMIFLEIIE